MSPSLDFDKMGRFPLVENMAGNSENPKICKEGMRTIAEILKNEFPTLTIGRGGPFTSQHPNLWPAYR